MRLALVLLLFLNPFSHSFSQKKVFKKDMGWQGAAAKIRLYTFPADRKDQAATVFFGRDSVKVFLLNSNMALLNEFTVPRRSINERFKGGMIRDNTICFFLESMDLIRSWIYDTKTGLVSEYVVPYDPQKEKTILTLSTGKRFVIITSEKKEPVLNFYDFNNKGSFIKHEYNLGTEDLKTGYTANDLWLSLTRPSGVGRELDLINVKEGVECDMDVANCPNKFYVRNDSLYLLMDKETGITRIFSFDLHKGSLGYRVIDRMLVGQPAVFNSFLLYDKLYYVNASEDSLHFIINDFYTGTSVQQFASDKDEEIGFKNTPVMQEGGNTTYSTNLSRELTKTKPFLKKLMNGRPIINCIKNDSAQCEITIGVYKEMNRLRGSDLVMMGAGLPVQNGGVPVSWTRVTRFKIKTDPHTGKQLPGDMRRSVNDRMEIYKSGVFTSSDNEAVLLLDEKTYYVYYDIAQRQFCAVRF